MKNVQCLDIFDASRLYADCKVREGFDIRRFIDETRKEFAQFCADLIQSRTSTHIELVVVNHQGESVLLEVGVNE